MKTSSRSTSIPAAIETVAADESLGKRYGISNRKAEAARKPAQTGWRECGSLMRA